MRQVILDTETTGLEATSRIVEIGCVEVIERKLTGRRYHVYIDPECEIPEEAARIHGITNEWLRENNAPVFAEIVDEFRQFIDGAEIVAHNANFDVARMDYEFSLLGRPSTTENCTVLDTLKLAKRLLPGARHTLDALCKRYDVNNEHRELHGALLDAELLASVYLAMTGGQTNLALATDIDAGQNHFELDLSGFNINANSLSVLSASPAELQAHESMLDLVDKKSGQAIWRQP